MDKIKSYKVKGEKISSSLVRFHVKVEWGSSPTPITTFINVGGAEKTFYITNNSTSFTYDINGSFSDTFDYIPDYYSVEVNGKITRLQNWGGDETDFSPSNMLLWVEVDASFDTFLIEDFGYIGAYDSNPQASNIYYGTKPWASGVWRDYRQMVLYSAPGMFHDDNPTSYKKDVRFSFSSVGPYLYYQQSSGNAIRTEIVAGSKLQVLINDAGAVLFGVNSSVPSNRFAKVTIQHSKIDGLGWEKGTVDYTLNYNNTHKGLPMEYSSREGYYTHQYSIKKLWVLPKPGHGTTLKEFNLSENDLLASQVTVSHVSPPGMEALSLQLVDGKFKSFAMTQKNKEMDVTLQIKDENYNTVATRTFTKFNNVTDAVTQYTSTETENAFKGTITNNRIAIRAAATSWNFMGVENISARYAYYDMDAATYGPTITSHSYKDINPNTAALTSNNQKVVQEESNVEFSVSAAAKKHAKITRLNIKLRGATRSKTFTNVTNITNEKIYFNKAAINKDEIAEIEVIDSRGFKATATKNVEGLPYFKPLHVAFAATRLNGYEEDSYLNYTVRFADIMKNNDNYSVSYRIKEENGAWNSFTTLTDWTIEDFEYNDYFELLENHFLQARDNNKRFFIELKAEDFLNTVVQTIVLDPGHGLAIIDKDGWAWQEPIYGIAIDGSKSRIATLADVGIAAPTVMSLSNDGLAAEVAELKQQIRELQQLVEGGNK